MTDEEIIAYALAHAAATLNMSGEEDAQCMELLYRYGFKIGVDVPLGDEYQRAVLHRFDPERVPDFPLTERAMPRVNATADVETVERLSREMDT
jgi:hypothetical protein